MPIPIPIHQPVTVILDADYTLHGKLSMGTPIQGGHAMEPEHNGINSIPKGAVRLDHSVTTEPVTSVTCCMEAKVWTLRIAVQASTARFGSGGIV